MNYTKKQMDVLKLWRKGELKRINIFEGAVRSGKTVASVILWGLCKTFLQRPSYYLIFLVHSFMSIFSRLLRPRDR